MKLQAQVLLETKNLFKNYVTPAQTVEVLKGINLKIYENEVLAIVGKSGVGKTTLLNILGLLDIPTQGSLSIRGQEVSNLNRLEYCFIRNKSIGIVFQFYHLLGDFTSLENVMMASMIHYTFWEWRGKLKQAYKKRALELLNVVGLSNRINHYPYQLSGGERQRVAIARALINNPDLILLDEPTGNLDSNTSDEIHELLWTLHGQLKKTFILVTHEESLAFRADRVIQMADGRALPMDLSLR